MLLPKVSPLVLEPGLESKGTHAERSDSPQIPPALAVGAMAGV